MATNDGDGVGGPTGPLPEAFGRYRILRELGRGGMGVVYKARHTVMNRDVVIKVISKALLDRPEALERFRREVQAAAQLAHPNIVTAYDAEQAGDTHFLVMEFVPGRSLAEVLEEKGPLPVAHACHYVRQAALGLQHAFEKGMVHRDIKPHNLMLTPKGQVKILDFGLAKLASEGGPGKGLTAANAYMGTPDYSAPEQAADARSADIRADLYSLGCTLYCLLAGWPPFREDTAVLTILAHLQKEPTPLPRFRSDVPPDLWAVVARLLAKDPAHRYQVPAEVAHALAPFCKPGGKTGPAPGTGGAGDPGGIEAEAATGPPRQASAPTGPPRDRTAAALPRDNQSAGLGAGPDRKRRGRRWGVLAGVLGCLGLLVLVSLGLGGLVALSLRTSGADSPRAPLSQPAAVAGTAAGGGGAPPALLDCTGAEGVSPAEAKQAQVAWAQYLGRPVEEEDEIAPGVRMTFVLVPPGTFLMGSPRDEGERSAWEKQFDAEAQHEVTLTRPFYLGKYEVTQAHYEALLGKDKNPSSFKGADLPVESVAWTEASAFADTWTKKRGDGLVYHLPTEAAWEYSCRGGRPSSHPFGIGDGTSLSSDQANFDGNYPYGGAAKGKDLGKTCRVGSYPPNAFGIHDMHGNVWEWCADWYGPYPAGNVSNPTGPGEGSSRVIRGGSCTSAGGHCRAANRHRYEPGSRNFHLGFRLARSVPSGGK
jgi:formylglycine-generating enzyme required for sulfatase activity/tRNA A-37 threonylcarbamoyl transferase component Bud32